jgi:hypothetical protein
MSAMHALAHQTKTVKRKRTRSTQATVAFGNQSDKHAHFLGPVGRSVGVIFIDCIDRTIHGIYILRRTDSASLN